MQIYGVNIQKMKIAIVKLSEIAADKNLNLSAKHWIDKKTKKKNEKQKDKD